jgi:glycine/D-amino acid oxidase-like deaminating enzyme
MSFTADVVICGAGIAGISAAYHLAVRHGLKNIVLVDERAPLSLTSDKSTEGYRNWWPGPGNAMVALMNRSIDIMEDLAHQSGNVFHLNRRGYLYLTADPSKVDAIVRDASEPSMLGAGELRLHTGQPGEPPYQLSPSDGFHGQPTGADLILDPKIIRDNFPCLSEHILAALHVRRAGWFSAQQLGMYLLDQARANGARLVNARVTQVRHLKNRVDSVVLDSGEILATRNFVNAAGPFLNDVGHLLNLDLPVYNELHLKVAFKDVLGIVPRNAPLLIWTDPQRLPWSPDEAALLQEDESSHSLLEEMPSGVHTRPEGGSDSDILLMLWAYRLHETGPVWPPPLDEQYPEIALRGLAAMIPGLQAYFYKAPRPVLDGGYYTKTRENRPLIGPLPVAGAYVIGALSGYGLMASCAAGELLAAHLTAATLPSYASAFSLERYRDSAYQKMLLDWGDSGQL